MWRFNIKSKVSVIVRSTNKLNSTNIFLSPSHIRLPSYSLNLFRPLSAFLAFDDGRGPYLLFRSVGENDNRDRLFNYLSSRSSFVLSRNSLLLRRSRERPQILIVADNKSRGCDGVEFFEQPSGPHYPHLLCPASCIWRGLLRNSCRLPLQNSHRSIWKIGLSQIIRISLVR